MGPQSGYRNFLYQHPRFGRESAPAPDKEWKETVYYLWWEYLRRHQGYRRCCENGGTGKYANLYKAFGSVHNISFRVWWRTHGAHLFAEPLELNVPRELEDPQLLDQIDRSRTGVWLVPLHMRKGYLVKTFKQFLKKRHIKGAVRLRRTSSRARYPVHGTKVVISSLATTLAVYDYAKAHPNATHWQIAEALGLASKYDKNDIHSIRDGRLVQTISVSRYLRHANAYIANTGEGLFPKK